MIVNKIEEEIVKNMLLKISRKEYYGNSVHREKENKFFGDLQIPKF